MVERADFFIASNSCNPGGYRAHANICVTDFKEAWKFARNTDPYSVFWYGWEMFIWQFKIRDGEVMLIRTFNLNDYVEGAIDKKGKLVKPDKLQKLKSYDDYVKVKYSRPDDIVLRYPLDKGVFVECQIPGQKTTDKFKVNCGYHWEDSGDLFDYDTVTGV